MRLPSYPMLILLVFINLFLFMLSSSVASAFDTGQFFSTNFPTDYTEIIAPTFSEGFFTAVLGLASWGIDVIGLFLNMLVFTISGLPFWFHLFISVPLAIINVYVVLGVIVRLVEVLWIG